MSIVTKALYIRVLLAAVCACDRGVSTPAGPRFRFKNGTILEDRQVIGLLPGTSLELYCTGKSDDLEVTKGFKFRVPITNVNETTIKLFVENVKQHYYTMYFCRDTKTRNYTIVTVLVDSLPMVSNFHCKSEDLQNINCAWTPNNIRCSFSLYYVEDGDSFLLCDLKTPRHRSSIYYDCTWDEKQTVVNYDKKSSYETLTFLINTCNLLGCANQTFVIDHYAVLKLSEPYHILMGKTSLSVVLKVCIMLVVEKKFVYDYKINYLQSGVHYFQVNGTGLNCYTDPESTCGCEVELKLPCADTHYEFWVSVKASTAVGDDFWSDPAVISVVTDPAPEGENAAATNPTCEHRRVKITPNIMLYELDTFQNEIIKEQKMLKGKIQSLKLKAGQIKQP